MFWGMDSVQLARLGEHKVGFQLLVFHHAREIVVIVVISSSTRFHYMLFRLFRR